MRLLVIQNCQVEGLGRYQHYLAQRGIKHDVVHPYLGQRLPGLRRYDAVISGGTPVPASAAPRHPWLGKVQRLLSQAIGEGRPVLGVCCSAQLMARALGGDVERGRAVEIGGAEVSLTDRGRSDPLFEGFPDRFPVFQWHADAFNIPDGAIHLVEGEVCPNQGFRKGRAVALLFHLEISAWDVPGWIEAYGDELEQVDKSTVTVLEECQSRDPRMQALSEKLIENFLAMA